jgi:hypothetical protein
MYRTMPVGDDFHEICDECGFHGGLLDLAGTVSRLRVLPGRWADVMRHDERLVRARPEPDTWCVVEYAQHVVSALGGILWAARLFADGIEPDWNDLDEDALPGEFEHPVHDCQRFTIADTLRDLGSAASAMADFAVALTPAEQASRAVYYRSTKSDYVEVLNTTAVVRHALHDAEHHLLDVRRGIARMELGS